jgi:hypothetical protein
MYACRKESKFCERITTMNKHTPRPWKYALTVQENGPNFYTVATSTFGGQFIAKVEKEADARLIAASPRLKDELIELCFNADTAIRYLRYAAEKEGTGLEGFILAIERQIGSARQTIDEAIGYTDEVKE